MNAQHTSLKASTDHSQKGGIGHLVYRERGFFSMSEHNKYIYKSDNGRLPERNNHHSWPPIIIENNHWHRNLKTGKCKQIVTKNN